MREIRTYGLTRGSRLLLPTLLDFVDFVDFVDNGLFSVHISTIKDKYSP